MYMFKVEYSHTGLIVTICSNLQLRHQCKILGALNVYTVDFEHMQRINQAGKNLFKVSNNDIWTTSMVVVLKP